MIINQNQNNMFQIILNIMAKINILGILKSVVSGVKDSTPVVATIAENIKSIGGGEGKVNWVRLASHVLSYTALIVAIAYGMFLVGKGVISIDQLGELIKQIK